MLADGFAPITQVQANLLFGENVAIAEGQVQTAPTEIGIGEVNGTGSAPSLKVTDLPATTPELFDLSDVEGAPVCLWYDDEAGHLTSGGTIPAGAAGGSDQAADGGTTPGAPSTGAEADRVILPPGKAAVVGERPGPGIKPESLLHRHRGGREVPGPQPRGPGKARLRQGRTGRDSRCVAASRPAGPGAHRRRGVPSGDLRHRTGRSGASQLAPACSAE